MANDTDHLETSSRIVVTGPPGRRYKITIEFPLFLFMLGLSLSGSAINNIILYRTCVHSLNHTEEQCKDFLSPIKLNSTIHLEGDVQKYATLVLTVKIAMESVVPGILSLFLGVWSDTYGRKPLIVWPMLGMALSSMLIVIYGLIDLNPWWYLLTVIPFSLTGGFVVMFTGSYCYVSDITTTQGATIRMTLIDATVSLGNVVGSLLSVYLIHLVGNVNILLISAALMVLGYSFTNIYIKESLAGAMEGGFCKILDWLYAKEMINECFKQRPNHGRAVILLLTAARSLTVFLLYGVGGLEYLYSREKLHWALEEYNQYSATNTALTFAGGFFGVAFLQKVLPINDLVFAMVSFISAGAEYIIKAFAVVSWQMYLSVLVSLFKGLSGPLIRSYVTKVVPVEDIAKVFALMCAIEGLTPLIAPIICNAIYISTLSSFPGTIYLVGTGLVAVCVVLTGFVQYFMWNAPTTHYRPLADDNN